MSRKRPDIKLPSVDDLFTSQAERDGEDASAVRMIAVDDLKPFPQHPFQVREDEDMEALVESVADQGILVPLTVRNADEGYVVISGHRRKRAAEIVGLEELPCIVRDLSEDEATIAMVDSNLQRETILPSERAFAYSMRLEAMKHQGKRSDSTCSQVGNKSVGRKSSDMLADELGLSKNGIYRFIRLTHLIEGLLDMVDSGRMKMLPAVEVSYLSQGEQESLLDAIEANQCTPSHAQAIKMKRFSKEGSLTDALIRSIMEEEKPNQVEQFKIPKRSIARFFRPNATKDEVEQRIVRALELLDKAERAKRTPPEGEA